MGVQNAGGRKWPPFGIFLLSFGISLAVLLAIVTAVLSAVFSPPGGTQTGEESAPEAADAALSYRPEAAMGLNLLVISVRERSDPPHAFTLCRFDPANDRILLVPIPPETVTAVQARTDTFAGHYDYAGSANVRMAAENLLGCEVGRYVRLSRGGAVNLIDALGGLTRHFDEGDAPCSMRWQMLRLRMRSRRPGGSRWPGNCSSSSLARRRTTGWIT